jgi:competence protein ComGC
MPCLVRMPVFVVVVRMIIVVVVVVVVIVFVPVRVSMASQNEEANEVGEEPSRTNNQDEFGVADLGRFHESCQGFENDGYAEGDEEDGIEESA